MYIDTLPALSLSNGEMPIEAKKQGAVSADKGEEQL